MVRSVLCTLNPWHRRLRPWPVLALLLTLLGYPALVAAQSRPITLTVQLLTVAREPVAGVAVRVIDAASAQLLARGVTDISGQARFAAMAPTEVRVRLTGTLPDGTALRHTRQDRNGIWVSLPARDWVMDLRADTDGLVFPDLGLGNAGAPDAGAATAIAAGALPTVYPTAPGATRAPRTSVPRPQIVPAPAPETAVSHSSTAPPSNALALVLLVGLVAALAGVVWVTRRTTRGTV